MITLEEKKLREILAIDEITFAIPAQSFAIECSISAEEALPVVTEFALRIAYVCGTLSPIQIQDFFGFTKKETDAIIQTLLNERLIKWNEDELLELTSYALTRFQDSSDHLPRFFKIQEWSSEVIFDLISFSPAGRPNRLKRVNSLVELAARNIERQSKTIQYAEQAFQEHFHSICKKNKAEIYKISAVDAGEHFSIPLPCMFHLDLDGQINIRRDIDNEAFNNRLEISEAITDALSNQDRPQNNSFMDFIHYFDYSLFERYVSNDTFDLRRYVQDVHLTRVVGYDNRHVTPLLGAFYLQHNADLIITRLGDEILKQEEMLVNNEVNLKSGEDGEEIDTLPVSEKNIVQSGLWLAPQLSLWARTRGAREFAQRVDRLLDSRNKKKSNPVGTYVMISGRNHAAKERAFKYRDQFQYLFNLDICLMDGKLELLLIPGLMVCVLFHFHLEHQPVSVPIGFISSEVEHLKIASSLISESTRSKQIFSSMYDSENVPVVYQGLQNLLDIISSI
ncbi:TPA: hypothetical protein ACQC5M_002618 [Escherichia albertii]|uniref:hypothetical protein n=1 Tax=Escherichia albertii TaxID=208962 RepID=UPI0007436B23|nr:hypothetical protein [Escherichia albertii]PFF96515.1 hypothetical protein CRH02_06135 [Escherichia albertii]HEB1543783.1 hypothetical protein [Escherichia albertii]